MVISYSLHQAEPQTAARMPTTLIDPIKSARNLVQLISWNPAPGIRHGQHNRRGLSLNHQVHPAAFRTVLERVIDQIHDQLEYKIAIAAYVRNRRQVA